MISWIPVLFLLPSNEIIWTPYIKIIIIDTIEISQVRFLRHINLISYVITAMFIIKSTKESKIQKDIVYIENLKWMVKTIESKKAQ